MPQIAQLALVYQSQWFWLLLTLGAIYLLVGRGIVPKVEATVDARDAQIASDLAEAERLRSEAEADEEAWRARLNAAHVDAQGVAAEAKAASARDAEARVHAADAEVASRVETATASLDEARQGALAQIEGLAAEAARDIVARLTGAQVDDLTARAAVAEALSRA